MIVEFARAYYEERREGAYVRDELNIGANAPFPLLSKSSVQKGGVIFGSLRYMQRYTLHIHVTPLLKILATASSKNPAYWLIV